MTWIELDDGILENRKFVRALRLGGSEALHMWLGFRAYCSKHLTDGRIELDLVNEVKGPTGKKRDAAIKILFEVGLLEHKDSSGDIWMHDYLEWSASREEVLKRRESARERKAKSRAPSQRDEQCDSPETKLVVTHPRARVSSPLLSTPGEEDPPTPGGSKSETRIKTRDPFGDSLGTGPQFDPAVLELHEAYRLAIAPEHKFRIGSTEPEVLAEALRLYGMGDCLLVLKEAMNDGMVNGTKDEQRNTHESIGYIFGNAAAFARILKAAKKKTAENSESVGEMIARRKAMQPGAA